MILQPNRRQALQALATLTTLAAAGCSSMPPRDPASITIAALFAGNVRDQGFMQSGYEGLVQARESLSVTTRYLDGMAPQKELLVAGLRQLAQAGPQMVIAHGGQNNAAAQQVASEFPAIHFAVTQGDVTGANLSSYEALQEESAWLAGALAGLSTRTGVVGHMSGIRVRPGLKGRAAFADGVKTSNPGARLLTNFSGNQDDNALSRRIALGQMDAGADIIFTMLNAGRDGVTQACRERGTRQIGNVRDWTLTDPDVFMASAIANVSRAVLMAAQDEAGGRWKPGVIRTLGLSDPSAVRLAMAPDVPAGLRQKIAVYTDAIIAGKIAVPDSYAGPEFALAA